MRTTTFDMIGMTLMAIVTILSTGGAITWAYLKEQRGGQAQDAVSATAEFDRHDPVSAPRSSAHIRSVAHDTETPATARADDRRVLVGHR